MSSTIVFLHVHICRCEKPLTAISQQVTYLYKLHLAHSSIKTQRYQKGCACDESGGYFRIMSKKLKIILTLYDRTDSHLKLVR